MDLLNLAVLMKPFINNFESELHAFLVDRVPDEFVTQIAIACFPKDFDMCFVFQQLGKTFKNVALPSQRRR